MAGLAIFTHKSTGALAQRGLHPPQRPLEGEVGPCPCGTLFIRPLGKISLVMRGMGGPMGRTPNPTVLEPNQAIIPQAARLGTGMGVGLRCSFLSTPHRILKEI